MNANLKLELNKDTLKALLPVLVKIWPYVFGLALVGVFGYTAEFLNTAVNIPPASAQSAIPPLPQVTFDKKVIESLSNRNSVSGDVPINLGNTNPF